MKLFLKITGWLMAATALAAAAATDNSPTASPGSVPSISDLLPDVVVAKGKGFEIKRSALDQAVISVRANATKNGEEIPPDQMPLVEKRSLDQLLLTKLLNGVATPEQKAQADREATTNFTELKKEFTTEEMMVRQFKSNGYTPDQVRSNMAESATARIVLAARVKISDDDVNKFYADNPSEMEEPEKASINFITMGGPDPVTGAPLANDQLAAKKKQIQDVLDRARHGEDFVKLAQEYSEDSASKVHDGVITVVRGMRGLPPEFETAAFSLNTNEISDVITTQFGFHIIKLKERTPARKATLAEATPEIRRYLEVTAINKMLPDYYAQLKKDENVEILDPKLKELEDAPPIPPPNAAGMPPGSASPPAGTQ